MKAEDPDYVKTNREKRLSNKKGLFWCEHCDAQLVYCGQRCPYCNVKQVKRILKEF